MGWQDRDWAKLDADELDALYGARPRSGTIRAGAAPAILVSALLAVGVGYLQLGRGGAPAPAVAAPQPSVLYGQPTAFAGEATACTELKLSTTGRWACVAVAVNERHLPVVAPPQYQGPCSHLSVDEPTGRWRCLGNVPTPDAQLPR